jgi:hypothetical protein
MPTPASAPVRRDGLGAYPRRLLGLDLAMTRQCSPQAMGDAQRRKEDTARLGPGHDSVVQSPGHGACPARAKEDAVHIRLRDHSIGNANQNKLVPTVLSPRLPSSMPPPIPP